MSFNLYLSNGIRNKKNKNKPMYEEFSLRQTPTSVTLDLIGRGNNDAICEGYISYVRSISDDAEDHIAELLQFRADWPGHEFWYI